MGELGWTELVALLTSIGFGAVSAVIPVVNAEAYVIASQVSAVVGSVPVAVGVGIGQMFGKLALFQGVRQGKEHRWFRRHRAERARRRPKGRARLRFDAFMARLLALVGTKRWGLPIVALAAVLGIPPLYAVALLAGATTMRTLWFALVVLAGRVTRFVLVAQGALGFLAWLS